MKIEFIKEQQGMESIPTFYTQVDGMYVSGSLSSDQSRARELYDKIVANKGVLNIKEVLHKTEILNSKTENL